MGKTDSAWGKLNSLSPSPAGGMEGGLRSVRKFPSAAASSSHSSSTHHGPCPGCGAASARVPGAPPSPFSSGLVARRAVWPAFIPSLSLPANTLPLQKWISTEAAPAWLVGLLQGQLCPARGSPRPLLAGPLQPPVGLTPCTHCHHALPAARAA